MEYKKSELTFFAKECARENSNIINSTLKGGEISHSELGRAVLSCHSNDNELIVEIAKRFSKVANDQFTPHIDNGEVQDFCEIIKKIVECCDENDWFGN